MKTFYKKPFFYIGLVVLLIIVIAGIKFTSQDKEIEYNTVQAEQGQLIQEVNVTGTVQPAESVELAFEKLGKVVNIKVKVGDTIKKGELLATLNSSDLYAQISQARASLESARALLSNYNSALTSQEVKLAELKRGTRAEELTIAQTTVFNAEKALADMQTNLTNVKAQAETNTQNQLKVTASSLSNSINTGLTSLYAITTIQETYFYDYTQDSYQVATAKEAAVFSLLGKPASGRITNSGLSGLAGGAKEIVKNAELNPTEFNVNQAITATKDAMFQLRNTLNAISLALLSSADLTILNTQRGYIDAEVSTIIANETAIFSQVATNQTSISTAQTSITTAQNTLQSAKDNLLLKQAGSTTEQIAAQESNIDLAKANVRSQEAQIKYAQANINNISAQLSKSSIRSPLTGTVVNQETKVGEIVTANTPVIRVMTDNNFEIEANIAEVDIANIKLEDKATVTLDAYGNDKEFEVSVIKIDPAETVIDGVPTYKVTFQFDQEDGLIKSGMTANLDIITSERENVVNIPQRSVLRSDGNKIVRVLNSDGSVKEVTVITGIRGTNGNIEIIEGIKANDTIILSIKN